MPVNYLNTGHTAGDEASSTNEGRYLTFEESYLTHPYHSDGLVDGKDPVLIGDNIVGVAMSGAAAATDLLSIDTEGIWFLNVLGCISDGTSDGIAHALAPGDPVYIQRTPGTDVYILSGESDPYHFAPFGYVLGDVSASTTVPTLAAVKVHNTMLSNLGVLHFGSGSTAAGNFLLEGSTTVRNAKLIEACIAPATILLAGEQIHGFNIRVVDNLISTGGEITAGELKVVRDEATDATVSAMTALKLNCDNKNGGAAPYARALDIMSEGTPGAAPDIRSGIHFNSSGTDGTLEGIFEIETGAFNSGAADKTGGAKTNYLSVIYGGVVKFIQLYDA